MNINKVRFVDVWKTTNDVSSILTNEIPNIRYRFNEIFIMYFQYKLFSFKYAVINAGILSLARNINKLKVTLFTTLINSLNVFNSLSSDENLHFQVKILLKLRTLIN